MWAVQIEWEGSGVPGGRRYSGGGSAFQPPPHLLIAPGLLPADSCPCGSGQLLADLRTCTCILPVQSHAELD